jgi:hypothetical protein
MGADDFFNWRNDSAVVQSHRDQTGDLVLGKRFTMSHHTI